MNLIEIFSIIIIHWIADFVLQTDKQVKGKSKNWSDLLSHTGVYSLVWLLVGGFIYLQQFKPFTPAHNDMMNIYWQYWIPRGLLFVLITFVCHTITDYFTSRLNSKLAPSATILTFGKNVYGSNEMIAYTKTASWHNFFVMVGFDQVLHYVQLFLTYYYLKT